MPKYNVTSPDGKKFEITVPEGASPQQVEEYVKSNFSKAAGMSSGDVASGAWENLVPSAKNFASNTVQPFLHPIDTATSVKDLGLGLLEKAGFKEPTGKEKYADAIGKFFADRYGGLENIKKTMATDPVGFMGDLSAVLTAGGAAVARAPGMVGKVGEITQSVGRAANPIALPLKAVEAAGPVAAQVVGNLGTHTGGESIKQAFRTGTEGGEVGKSFRDNMRGNVSPDVVVQEARDALKGMRRERSAEYQSGMAGVSKDSTVLKFDDVDQALKQGSVKWPAGLDAPAPVAEQTRRQLAQAVEHWKAQNPTEWHTPSGMDALKQYIGEIRDTLPFNSPERRVAEQAYTAVRGTIAKQAPEYAKVMADYEKASTQIDEISKTLSLNPKASVDTALRKLQSAMRSNVNTNFGKRTELTQELADRGAPKLMGDLAGQSLSPWTPAGLGKLTAGGIGAAALSHPLAAAALPFTSPRLMGEAAHAGGRVVGAVPEGLRSAATAPPTMDAILAGQYTGRAADALDTQGGPK